MMVSLYDHDVNQWLEQTAQTLKARDFHSLDLDNLIEEIESMGRNNKRKLSSRLIVLLMHLLKWDCQPEKRTPSWLSTINEQRR